MKLIDFRVGRRMDIGADARDAIEKGEYTYSLILPPGPLPLYKHPLGIHCSGCDKRRYRFCVMVTFNNIQDCQIMFCEHCYLGRIREELKALNTCSWHPFKPLDIEATLDRQRELIKERIQHLETIERTDDQEVPS